MPNMVAYQVTDKESISFIALPTELNVIHYIQWNKHYLGCVIELDEYVSIWLLSRIHPQRYVLWYNSFMRQNYIEF